MKAKKLVSLAVPFLLLIGCGTDKTDAKPKEKVESKAETKEKLSKDKYPERITSISSEFLQKVADISETAKDRTRPDKEVATTLLTQVNDVQKIIKKFDTIEPPVEFQDAHKDLLKAVDCYSEAYAIQAQLLTADKRVDKSKAEKAKDLMKKGSELWATGFQPIQDVVVGKVNEIEGKTASKTDSSSTSDTSTLSNETVQISRDGKELFGEWGSYKGSDFHKGIEFREDGSFTAYDDTGKTSYEDNHMEGSWYYSEETNLVTLMPKEFVKDGKKIDRNQLEVAIDYKIESFKEGSFKMVDEKGNRLEGERRK
ncbi:DUF3994 domain-containing protein [Bacillus pseudomycoides]|uniref:DUF3994 domain-containing protein n=1 Tax=Bacillus pseudomycoides TaxID=64104 RepID=A0ABD6SZ79_9BACI|nr:DUF3994 domain-containing protein [Bacillus pseudomycoides]EEM01741.1 hypothetical protein bmyco0002_59550 [Bacillus pseudomycoides]EEM07522.1 hypothetical protein bmyco0003_58130 [Bacillus pseudomycoides]KFN15384.1 hypothetical protein DJ94_811 [Bacillus pseudomycoides]MDR4188457.1 DUF3994 domain-containing protein [Bacillus pseudomycoides]MED0857841.1 DUF3994 domain-containing protein [Bacillus pseudomycoides]